MQESKRWRPEDTDHHPEAELQVVSSELPAVSAGKKTQILWESNACSQLRSHLSRPYIPEFYLPFLVTKVCLENPTAACPNLGNTFFQVVGAARTRMEGSRGCGT